MDFWPDPVAGLVSSRQDSFRAQVPPAGDLGAAAATSSLPHEPTAAAAAGQHGAETTRTAHPVGRIASPPQAPPSRLVRTLTARDAAYGVAFSPEGSILATCGGSGVWLWDPATGQHLRTIEDRASSVAFSPDGHLFAGSAYGSVKVWDPVTGESLRTLRCAAIAMAFSPDGRILAIVDSSTAQLWDSATGQHLRTLTLTHDKVIESPYSYAPWFSYAPWRGLLPSPGLAFSPDGRIIATGSSGSKVRLWDPATGQHLRTIDDHKKAVCCVAFSPDGRIIATGSSDSTVRLWDPATGQHLRTIKGHTILRRHIGRISIRDTLGRPKSDTRAMAFSPDGRVLATITHETAHLWDPATGQHMRSLIHKEFLWCVAFSPDGRMLATGSDLSGSTVRLWG